MIPDAIKAQLTDNEIKFLEEAITQAKLATDGIVLPDAVVIQARLPMAHKASEQLLTKLESRGLVKRTGRVVIGGSQFKVSPDLL